MSGFRDKKQLKTEAENGTDTLPPLALPSDWHNKLVSAGEGARSEVKRARGVSGVKLLLKPGCERCMPFPTGS